ncbi:MAG: putative bifunctional diguanylate cyclase/phosphodiesterase [Anaerolineaceae bacterium]
MIRLFRNKHPYIFWFSVILILIFPSITAILLLIVKDDSLRTIISDISSPIIDLICVGALIYAAVHSYKLSRRIAIAWWVLALSLLSYTIGDILWGIDELLNQKAIYYSIADGAYLLFYPLFFIGIMLQPLRKTSFYEWLKKALDLGTVMIAATLGIWIYIIGPVLGTNFQAITKDVWVAVAYPVGDLIIFFGLLFLVYSRSRKTNLGSIIILALGMMIMIITDLIYTYSSSLAIYASGNVLDLGWIVSNILIAVAGIYQGVYAENQEKENNPSDSSIIKIEKRVAQSLTYLPFIWIIGAFYLLRQFHLSEDIIDPNVLFFSIAVIIAFVIIRQIFALQENNRLLSDLTDTLDLENRHVSDLNKLNLNLQQEIIKRKRVEEQLSHDALHDGLTGLPNRVLFMDRLVHAIELQKRDPNFIYSVLFLDIDNFKAINDGLGHTFGDQALVEISKRLTSSIRSIDTVARLGGDEFIILLEHVMGRNTAIEVANRLTFIINQPFIHKNRKVQITCSIGVIMDISEYTFSEDILRDVDIALYSAKEKGKSQYDIFNLEMRDQVMSRIELEGDLRQSVSNGELFLVYQPIYSLDQNKLVGFEALVRWLHPLRGLIMPSEFIPIAEECGYITQLGDWVLNESCSQLKTWHNEFSTMSDLVINVNISGKQIIQSDFIDKVKNILQKTGLNPHRLVLEITETSFIDNQILIDDILTNLRQIGVSFAIDDFGTGYFSLGYLKNFSVDSIKIDKSFIDRIVNDEKGFEIVKSIIQIAQKLGIKAVAEGIENDDQLKNLQSLSCKYGQGYFLSKPVDVEKIDMILKSIGNIA